MKQDIKLYISDMLVDYSSEISLPFVYQLEDVNNPTIVKNFFTKTITITGTKQNNKIFGEIYNFDRTQLYDENYLTGVYFNPSYRTPFKLFKNGELIESGYMQLNSVTLQNNVVKYEITLYGGLGDFFYNLMYGEDNEKLTLADLTYGVQDEDGVTITPEREMDFKINAHFVNKCWKSLENLNYEDSKITDFITFVPSYNGYYNNFDNNKCLINTHNCSAFKTTSKTVDSVKYSAYNGFALAELKNDMTEWEIRDLRSYMQRPAIRMKKLIQAICNPENNGGYTVDLDSSFFNPGNPYYQKAYIALPLFSTSLESNEGSDSEEQAIKLYSSLNIGYNAGALVSTNSAYVVPKVNGAVTANGYVLDATSLPMSTIFDNYVDFQLQYSTTDAKQSNLYDSYMLYVLTPFGAVYPIAYVTGTSVQIVAYDNDDNVIGYSNVYTFANFLDDVHITTNYKPYDAPVTYIDGRWDYDKASDKYYFYSRENANTFRLEMNNIKNKGNFRIKLHIWREFATSENFSGIEFNPGALFKNVVYSDAEPPQSSSGQFTPVIDGKIISNLPSTNIYSNALLTKQKLLKTENTPADYLLSYCKLFGLYFTKDNADKKIYIRQRNNFFTNNTIDWSDRIDYSKEVKITPIVFDKKFYKFNLKGKDSYYSKKYLNEYGVDYGQKRLNTAYNFNSDTTELLKDNSFENSVPVLDTSQYYRLYYDKNGVEVPPFMTDGINYKLFNVTATEIQSTDIDMPSNINIKATVNFNDKSGYDFYAKQAFFNMENGKKSLNDINSCLLFYTGQMWANVSPGNDEYESLNIKYWLTDDTEEMSLLNDKKPCYIYTEDAFAENNAFIGYPVDNLPQFLSYNINVNGVQDSWDFGVPKEIFIPNTNYDQATTVFERYWADFYKDQLDINTKKITCYVNLEGVNVNSDILRNFYYFGNSYWILNKIDNYNPNAYGTTKCEFIKVQNTYNYTKKIGVANKYLTAEYPTTVDYTAGSVAVTVDSSVDWEVASIYNSNILRIEDEIGGPGKTVIYVHYTQNDSYATTPISFSIEEIGNPNNRYVVTITQKPNPRNTSYMSGVIKWDNGGIPPVPRIIILDSNDNYINGVYADKYTGEYGIYVPVGSGYTIEIQANIKYGGDAIYQTSLSNMTNRPITKNFVIPYVPSEF